MNRTHWLTGAAVVALAMVVGGAGARAAEPAGPPSSSLVEQVAGINRSMERLTTMLEELLENQRIDLLLKRIELKERRIAPMEGRLRTLENELSNLAQYLTELEARKEQMEQELRDEIRQTGEIDEDQAKRMEDEMEMMLGLERARMEGVQTRIRATEDELAESRKEIEILDEMLIELLADRER